jgi:8-oxo-dGTP diphosphatase
MRDAPLRHPVVAVGALIIREQRVLLVQRANPPLAGEWSLPGGRIEFGETIIAALQREVREETGLAVEPRNLACLLDRIGDDHHYVLIDYLCDITGGDLRVGSDALAARWASRDDLLSLGVAKFTCEAILRFL